MAEPEGAALVACRKPSPHGGPGSASCERQRGHDGKEHADRRSVWDGTYWRVCTPCAEAVLAGEPVTCLDHAWYYRLQAKASQVEPQ